MKMNATEVQKFPHLLIQTWKTAEVNHIRSGACEVFPDSYPRVVLSFGIEQSLNPSTHICSLGYIQWICIVEEYDSTRPVGHSVSFETSECEIERHRGAESYPSASPADVRHLGLLGQPRCLRRAQLGVLVGAHGPDGAQEGGDLVV